MLIIIMNFDISIRLTFKISPIICHRMKILLTKNIFTQHGEVTPNSCKKKNTLSIKT